MKKSQGRFGKQELAHPDIQKETDADEVGNQGRPAITKKGQGNTHDRQHAGNHGMFIKICQKIIAARPTANRLPKLSRLERAICKLQRITSI